MTKFWRCYAEECSEDIHGRLGWDFTAPAPVCPKCGADGRKPEGKQVVIRLETLHYIYASKDGPIITPKGRRRIACGGVAKGGILGEQRCTVAPAVVNCPACKATPAFAEAAERAGTLEVPADKDFGVEIDTDTMTVRHASGVKEG